MATVYLEADVPALVRLADLVERQGSLTKVELGTMLQLEDRFGLNPRARRALQWEVGQAEKVRPRRPHDVPKLRAVE